jgi:hypothetical protein
MLKREMEDAVSICPDLFIEPGLTLVRQQAVIDGRRPDLLFSDSLSRHLLVELQCGRLDEDGLTMSWATRTPTEAFLLLL